MTIIMKASWNGLEQGTVQNLGATEEARLIAAGIAAAHTATASTQLLGDAVVTRDGRIVVRDDAAGGGEQVVGPVPYPSTHRLVGPIQTVADYPGLTSWMWGSVIDTSECPCIVSPLARYYLYTSTDHSTRGGVRVLYSNSLEGPWTLYRGGSDPAATDIIFEDIDQAASASVSISTETPDVVYDAENNQLVMFYQVINPMFGNGSAAKTNVNDLNGGRTGGTLNVANQSTMRAVGTDGLRWGKDRNFKIDLPFATTGYGVGGHTGYFNPFKLRGRWYAFHLGQGAKPGQMLLSRSTKGLADWETDLTPMPTHQSALRAAGRPANEVVAWIHSRVIDTDQGLCLLGVSTDKTPSVSPTSGCLFVVPIADDLRTLTGPVTVLNDYSEAWQEDNGGIHIGWHRIGSEYAGIFLTQGATKYMGVHYVR